MNEARFPLVFEAVQASHEQYHLQGGHDIFHATRVANMAYKIAMKEWSDPHLADLAYLAGLCHNADRVMQKKLGLIRGVVPEVLVFDLVFSWLKHSELSITTQQEIASVVIRHENKNEKEDSKMQIALQDADRVVNLALDLIIRSGQHLHDLPAVDFDHYLDDPDASYRYPGSSLRDIAYTLEWMDPKSPYSIRTNMGRLIGAKRILELENYFEILLGQLHEEGLVLQISN